MRKKNSKLHEYLVCSNNRDGYDDCINKSSIRYDVLEEIVLSYVNKMIDRFYDLDVLESELKLKELALITLTSSVAITVLSK